MRIRFIDATPEVGIFEIIDKEIGVMSDTIDNLPSVNGIVDAGKLFHRDLLREMYKSNSTNITPETREFIKKNYYNSDLHRCFPRGRLCYNENDKCFELYSNREVLENVPLVRRILAEFGVSGRKVVPYVDEQHYSLLPREDL